MNKVSENKFLAYEEVRKSGKTNMFDISNVIGLSGGILSKEDCLEIMKNYSELKDEYLA